MKCPNCHTTVTTVDPEFKLREENADLRAQLTAANKRLEEAEKQEPVARFQLVGSEYQQVTSDAEYIAEMNIDMSGTFPLYTRPIPPADVAELQHEVERYKRAYGHECAIRARRGQMLLELDARIAELERKLAELQAVFERIAKQFSLNGLPDVEKRELNKLLSEAREEGRKEAVPDGLLDRLTRHVVVGEDDSKWVELCDIEAALAL